MIGDYSPAHDVMRVALDTQKRSSGHFSYVALGRLERILSYIFVMWVIYSLATV